MLKKLLIFFALLILLSACDKTDNLPIEMISEMVTNVAAEHNLILEADEFGEPEGAILAIYAPEVQASRYRFYSKGIPYTEIWVDDYTQLYFDSYDNKLLSTADKSISILIFYSNTGRSFNEIYTIDDEEMLALKQYDIKMPLNNIVDRTMNLKDLRYIILVPRWTTMSPSKEVVDEEYNDIVKNTISVIEEALKHIDIEK